MEARDKRILIQSVSAVLIIVVLFNVYSGITVSKIGIPGLLDIEFNGGNDKSDTKVNPSEVNSNGESDDSGQRTVKPADINRNTLGDRPEKYYDPNIYDPENPQDEGPEDKPIQPRAGMVDLTGMWYGADGSEYELSQSGGTVYFTEYGLFGATANGSGTYQNNTVTFDYETVFGTVGTATLNISENGRVLSGRANDIVSGTTTELYLTRY